MSLVKFKDVLENPEKFSGWLYSKSDMLYLDSDVIFYVAGIDLTPEAEKQEREKLLASGWFSRISSEDIEDVVINASEQLVDPAMDELLKAINYYLVNDAFIEF